MKIAISRTDNIGDVVLTFPMTGLLKEYFPDAEIIWIGKQYTQPVVESCRYVNKFYLLEDFLNYCKSEETIDLDAIIHVFPQFSLAQLAARARIRMRIGTSHRWFHWLYCNKLVHFGRKNSSFHEAQLNIFLLKPLVNKKILLSWEEIAHLYGFVAPQEEINAINQEKFVILHPKSRGSAREWALANYLSLVEIFEKQGVKCFITGTQAEGAALAQQCPHLLQHSNVVNFTGKLNLKQLIALISKSLGLIACSTGPLHIAAALGKPTVGIYPPIRPMHPGRWAPIGLKATFLAVEKNCNACRKSMQCACVNAIKPQEVVTAFEKLCSK
ncbi:MAG: glycosyltransferase family 9 protein [Cytophagales bacterium]|nr:glycosyltransferase family 9 protein [Bernardetiaceae bacterium]MDW8211634.1 glycosyltransferase family 9 protein [Cytophagales bacterium]